MASVVEACERPGDEDWGEARTGSLWIAYGRRPAHTQGPAGACHPEQLELSLVDRGHERIWAGSVLIDGERACYSVIPPGVVHSSATLGQASVGLTLHLAASVIERASDELGVARGGFCAVSVRASPSLDRVLAALRAEVLSPVPSLPMLDGMSSYLAGELLATHRPPGRHLAALERDRPRGLARSIELMHASLDAPLPLDEAARAAGLSRFRFSHLFKQRHGMSPYAFHRRLRLQRAAERVRTSNAPLATIALDLGFGTASRLTEAFRKTYGRTPSEWRNEERR